MEPSCARHLQSRRPPQCCRRSRCPPGVAEPQHAVDQDGPATRLRVAVRRAELRASRDVDRVLKGGTRETASVLCALRLRAGRSLAGRSRPRRWPVAPGSAPPPLVGQDWPLRSVYRRQIRNYSHLLAAATAPPSRGPLTRAALSASFPVRSLQADQDTGVAEPPRSSLRLYSSRTALSHAGRGAWWLA